MLKRFFEAKSFIFHIPKPIQVPNFSEKMSQEALNRVLRLDCSGAGDLLQSPLKIMDLQNKNISVVKKH